MAGDRGNLFALIQRCAWRGIRYSVTEADVGEVPDFGQCDLILLHGGQDREMTAAARDLAAKAGPLREAIESDAVVLAVCAGYQLLGRYYAPPAGPPIAGSWRAGRGHRRRPDPLHRARGGGVRPGRRAGSASSPGSRTTAGAPTWAVAPGRSGGCSPGRATTGRTAPRAPATGRCTPPTCTGRCCRRTRGWPTTCSPGRWRTVTGTFSPLTPLTDQAEAQAHAAALRLAHRPAGRWRAAAAAVSRLGARTAEPGHAVQPAAGLADGGTAWTSH